MCGNIPGDLHKLFHFIFKFFIILIIIFFLITEEFYTYIDYVRALKFEEKPDYIMI